MLKSTSTPRSWSRIGICALLLAFLTGCVPQPAYHHPAPQTLYARKFERLWQNYDRYYPYFDYKHIHWNAEYARYRPQVAKVRNDAQFLALLKRMLAPLKDVHAVLVTPSGRWIHTYEPPRFDRPNWNFASLKKNVKNLTWYGTKWGTGTVDGIPYIVIAAWTHAGFSVSNFDYLFNRYRRSPALILDVRMNGGGDDRLAYAVAGRFTTQTHLTEYLQFRNGPLHSDLTPLKPRYLKPRGSWQFSKPVALLIGPDCFSSNESFIAAMQTLPNVITIGAITGGGSGDPRFFDLGAGWRYSVPTWIDYTAGKRVIEWNGIPPDVPVKTTPRDFRHGADPVLEAAIRVLEAKLHASRELKPQTGPAG